MEHLRSVRASVRFGAFELDQDAGELRKQGTRMKLQEQPLQMLQVLLQRPGEVVTREELQQKIWPSDTFVDFDHGINNAIKRLREALGDAAETPRNLASARLPFYWKNRVRSSADAVLGSPAPGKSVARSPAG